MTRKKFDDLLSDYVRGAVDERVRVREIVGPQLRNLQHDIGMIRLLLLNDGRVYKGYEPEEALALADNASNQCDAILAAIDAESGGGDE